MVRTLTCYMMILPYLLFLGWAPHRHSSPSLLPPCFSPQLLTSGRKSREVAENNLFFFFSPALAFRHRASIQQKQGKNRPLSQQKGVCARCRCYFQSILVAPKSRRVEGCLPCARIFFLSFLFCLVWWAGCLHTLFQPKKGSFFRPSKNKSPAPSRLLPTNPRNNVRCADDQHHWVL